MSLAPSPARVADRWSGLTQPVVVVVAIVALVATACAGDGEGSSSSVPVADSTAPSPDIPPATGSDDTTPSDPSVRSSVEPEGFSTVAVEIISPEGKVCEVCMWLADAADERARGLMGVTDLGGAAGMLFAFDDETNGSFYMYRTPTPLSIAWFDADGQFVSATDMEPCVDRSAGDCPRYSAVDGYRWAIETFAGGLAPLGILPGSVLRIVDSSEVSTCP